MKRLLVWSLACIENRRQDFVTGHGEYLTLLDALLEVPPVHDAERGELTVDDMERL